MSEYKTTLIGIETYLSMENKSVFDELSLPADMSRQTLIDSILMRSGEFEVLYSDPELMTKLVGIWSRKYYDTFSRWTKALRIKYDPLNNYDRTEEIIDKTIKKETSTGNSDTTGKGKRTDETDIDNDISVDYEEDHNDNVTTEFSESAYNESDPSSKTITDADTTIDMNTSTTTENDTHTETESNNTYEDHNKSTGSRDEDGTYERKARMFGNIGVTTSQQMLESELNLGYWNLYNRITDMFISEFLLLVY